MTREKKLMRSCSFCCLCAAVAALGVGTSPLRADTEPCANSSPAPPTLTLSMDFLNSGATIVPRGSVFCITDLNASGRSIKIGLHVSGLEPGTAAARKIFGGQYLFNFTNDTCGCVLGLSSSPAFSNITIGPGNPDDLTDSPFILGVQFPKVDPTMCGGLGVPGMLSSVFPGGSPTACDNRMATIALGVGTQGKFVVWILPTNPLNPNPVAQTTHLTDENLVDIEVPPLVLTQDAPGNAITIIFDFTPPVITCPPDVTIECRESRAPSNTGSPTANDNCGAVIITSSDSFVSACDGTGVITRTWTATDECGLTSSCVQTITVVDTMVPVFTLCESTTVSVTIPPGGACETDVDLQPQFAVTDSCTATTDMIVDCTRSDGVACTVDMTLVPPVVTTGPFPCGTTTVSLTATDQCGNISLPCAFAVTVIATVDVLVTVEIPALRTFVGAPPRTVTRCITFELDSCPVPPSPLATCGPTLPVVVDLLMTFDNSGMAVDTFPVPCDQYTCITARDRAHTLRRTISPLPNNGLQFVADFTSANGKHLLSGNANDDSCIGITDFATFLLGFGDMALGANTDCTMPPPFPPGHADFNGDGIVSLPDFNDALLANVFKCRESNCCGNPFARDADGGSRDWISLRESRQMSAASANVNLEWRLEPPVSGLVRVGDTVRIGLFAVSDDQTNQSMKSMQVIFTWDPTSLQLLGALNNGVPWFTAGFLPNPLNESNPPLDGDGIYFALAPLSPPLPAATPSGILVTTLQFRALATTCGRVLGIPAFLGA